MKLMKFVLTIVFILNVASNLYAVDNKPSPSEEQTLVNYDEKQKEKLTDDFLKQVIIDNKLNENNQIISNLKNNIIDDYSLLIHNAILSDEALEKLCQLTWLNTLSLPHNQLKNIPSSIIKLTKLIDLDLSNNNLQNLPIEIEKLTKLYSLNLENNPNFEPVGSETVLGKVELINLFNNKIIEFYKLTEDEFNFYRPLQNEEQLNSIAKLYEVSYRDFYRTLRSKTPKSYDPLPKDFEEFDSPLIIANQDQYIKEDNTKIEFKTGAKLTVKYEGESYPIGYTIYFPQDINTIDAIQVEVYGGNSNPYEIVKLNNINAYLARHNVMIIKLNLPDLLDNNVGQIKMTQDYMNKLQFCIHHFWKTFTENPEFLHEDLKNIDKNMPKYLSGASFGGLTALLQAEQYPGTWTGYISHNGGLSPSKSNQWDFRNRGNYILQSDPSKLNDLFLILGNAHDNNVNMRNWTNFYKKIKKLGKKDLIKSLFTYEGINFTEFQTGHGAPNNPKDLLIYVKFILGFMKKDKNVHNNIQSEYNNLIGFIKSFENDIAASVEKLFLAEAYEQEYEKNCSLDKEKLRDIFGTFAIIKHKSHLLWNIINAQTTEEHLKKGFARDYVAWIYFVQNIKNIQDNNMKLMSDEVFTHLNIEFTPELLDIYKKSLLDLSFCYYFKNDGYHRISFLRSMRSFFIENPDLVRDLFDFQEEAFEKALKKWEKFKEKEKKLKRELPHFVEKDENESLQEENVENSNIIL